MEKVLDFYQVRVGLSELDGLVVRGSHIVISAAMRKIILERIHDGYQGLVKCGDRASQFGWWPKMSEDIKTKYISVNSGGKIGTHREKNL